MKKLSVAIAVYNEEDNVRSCLDAVVSWADEIVIVDGKSSDRTVEIAKKFKAKIIVTDNPPIFHINKQKAVDACRGDWILQLDADEVVTPELRDEIRKIISETGNWKLETGRYPRIYSSSVSEKFSLRSNNKDIRGYEMSSRVYGYFLPRKNYFLGRWLHKGGQYPDYVMRLFKRGKGRFPCKSVHEQIQIDGSTGYLNNPLLHYTSRTLKEYWQKANAYIALTTEEYNEKNLSKNVITYIEYNLVKPMITFLSLFIRHKGFLDGYYGFLFALFSALHHPLSYWKYRMLHQK